MSLRERLDRTINSAPALTGLTVAVLITAAALVLPAVTPGAHLVAAQALPEDTADTVLMAVQDLPPGPSAVYQSAFDVTDPPASFEIISIVLDFEPGAWTPMHTHGGLGMVTVLDGTVTRESLGGERHSFGPGESWLETGEVEAAGNDTDAQARVVFTLMLPRGEEVTIPHQ